MDDQFTSPVVVPPSRSRLKSGMRRLWYWLRAVVLRLEAPEAGEYDRIVSTLATVQEELIATQIELAVTKARLKAASIEVQSLAEVVARDRSRVAAEIAANEVGRAKAIANAGDFRRES